jgi:hypothetical protein
LTIKQQISQPMRRPKARHQLARQARLKKVTNRNSLCNQRPRKHQMRRNPAMQRSLQKPPIWHRLLTPSRSCSNTHSARQRKSKRSQQNNHNHTHLISISSRQSHEKRSSLSLPSQPNRRTSALR